MDESLEDEIKAVGDRTRRQLAVEGAREIALVVVPLYTSLRKEGMDWRAAAYTVAVVITESLNE